MRSKNRWTDTLQAQGSPALPIWRPMWSAWLGVYVRGRSFGTGGRERRTSGRGLGPPSTSKQSVCGDRRMRRLRGTSALTAALVVMLDAALASCGSTAAAPGRADPRPTLTFHVVVKTTQKLDSIVWTGRQFLYVQNTQNTVWAAPPAGPPLHKF